MLDVRTFLCRLSRSLQALLFPTKCRACGEIFSPGEAEGSLSFEEAMSPFLCPSCRAGFQEVSSPLCPVCGEVFLSREGEDHLCGPCISTPKPFGKARAVGIYEKGLLKAVHCLKYKGRTELAAPLGRLLFKGFTKHWAPGEIDLVLPVPLHPARMRMRGFNQSFLLIRGWPELAAGSAWGDLEAAPGLLLRKRKTKSQTGLARPERLKNLKGAFAVRKPDCIKNRRILLVDDVYTTGATASACASALLSDGAHRVDILTLARTMGK